MKLLHCKNPCLPDEVIEQTLLLLPPKSIGKCRCVSKQWRALFSSPQFIKAHTSIIRTQALQAQSVSIFTDTSWMRFTLTNDNQVIASGAHHNLHLLSPIYRGVSCDGLVLVLVDALQAFLINPTTRHTTEIPIVMTHLFTGPMTPTMRVTLHGIGFDSVGNDYKVVSLIYDRKFDDSSHEVSVHIYSVNDGEWKSCISLPKFFGSRFHVLWTRGVFVGRCIHWLIRRDTDDIAVIVAFDVVEEKFCQVSNPMHHSFEYVPHKYKYRIRAGGLCVSTMTGRYLNVWVMNEYGIQESWTRIVKIKVMKKWFVPFCWVGQQNLVLLQYDKANKLEKLVTYNVAEKMFKDIDIPDDIKDDLDYVTIPFAETMVSPYGMRGEC